MTLFYQNILVLPICPRSTTAKVLIFTAFKAHIFLKRGRFWTLFYYFYAAIHMSPITTRLALKKLLINTGFNAPLKIKVGIFLPFFFQNCLSPIVERSTNG
nr:MAG TPA: hypothetical protein [Caudoviricetes sp.]